MINFHVRPALPSLLATFTVLLVHTQITFAQGAQQPVNLAAAPHASIVSTQAATADALDPREPAAAPPPQFFTSDVDATAAANAPRSNAAGLFTRATLRDDKVSGASHQAAGSQPAFAPLTPDQKMKRAARNAFFSPFGIGRTLVSSAITQYKEEDQPQKDRGDKFADGASRFAINFGRRATRTLLGSGVYPILFRQDPRYDRAREGKNFVVRAVHAVSRVFVQRGDSGRLQPAVSRWAGSLSASAISNIWERSTPGHDRIGADATYKRFANSFISDSINHLFNEFWPDLRKVFGK